LSNADHLRSKSRNGEGGNLSDASRFWFNTGPGHTIAQHASTGIGPNFNDGALRAELQKIGPVIVLSRLPDQVVQSNHSPPNSDPVILLSR